MQSTHYTHACNMTCIIYMLIYIVVSDSSHWPPIACFPTLESGLICRSFAPWGITDARLSRHGTGSQGTGSICLGVWQMWAVTQMPDSPAEPCPVTR